MALNPPLIAASQTPLPVHSETFLLMRRGLRFEASTSDGRNYDENGFLYLSTLRMVFVKDQSSSSSNWFSSLLGQPAPTSGLQAFDLPLSLIRHEKFNQPIFGCNNISGECSPLPGTGFHTKFKLSFHEGGVGTLLPMFFDLLNRNRVGAPAQPSGLDSAFQSAISSGTFIRSAFIDPNDPSTIFLSRDQPSQSSGISREEYYRSGYQRVPSSDPEERPPARVPVIIPTATAPVRRPAPASEMSSSPSDRPSAPPPPEGWKDSSSER